MGTGMPVHLKILMASKFVPTGRSPVGGVQTWSATVAKELIRRGHVVHFWEPGFPDPGRYDLGIFANHRHTDHLFCNADKTLLITHGIIQEEKPVYGCDFVAAVSEEVRDHWELDCPIIRQPIDLDFWTEQITRRQAVIRYSYRAGLPEAQHAASILGLPYYHNRKLDHHTAKPMLQRAQCVLASGRSALEAMACGAPVVIADARTHYMKPLFSTDIEGQMERSYSGRGGHVPTPDGLCEAIRAAIQRGSLRGWVEKHHDSKKIVDQILGILQ